jgi:hypothetical protein
MTNENITVSLTKDEVNQIKDLLVQRKDNAMFEASEYEPGSVEYEGWMTAAVNSVMILDKLSK